MGISRKNLVISEKDKTITAYHEGGHALTALLTEGSTPLHKVTILPRGDSLGFVNIYLNMIGKTSMVPSHESYGITRKGLLA